MVLSIELTPRQRGYRQSLIDAVNDSTPRTPERKAAYERLMNYEETLLKKGING